MDSKINYLELEAACRKYIPGINHHSCENIIRPEEQFVRIKLGDEPIRVIKEEDADVMWNSASMFLESYMKGFFRRSKKEAKNV